MSAKYKEYDPQTLKRLQGVLLEILDDVSALCERHGLRWWTAFGTTIGVLRHGGMIPWDDDIDLAMLRGDYEKLLSAVETEMGDKYFVLEADREPECPFPSARICLRGTVFRESGFRDVDLPFGIFIDVYCYERLSDDPETAHRQWGRAWLWGKLMILRGVRSPVVYCSGFRAVLMLAACFVGHYALRLFTTRDFLWRRAKRWARLCDGCETARVFYPFCHVPYRDFYRVDEIFPTRMLPFDGRSVRVARDADAELRRVFGDFMTLPPPGERHNHPPMDLDFGKYGAESPGTGREPPFAAGKKRCP